MISTDTAKDPLYTDKTKQNKQARKIDARENKKEKRPAQKLENNRVCAENEVINFLSFHVKEKQA